MELLELPNIQLAVLFPRDLTRLSLRPHVIEPIEAIVPEQREPSSHARIASRRVSSSQRHSAM